MKPKNRKCMFISSILECYVSGEGTALCHNEDFHNRCAFKKRALQKPKQNA